MEPKTSTGLDGLSNKIIKMFGDVLSNRLSLLMNKSYEEGIFPDRLKEAKIVSLHKSGKLNDPNNYRSISLLNSISRESQFSDKFPIEQNMYILSICFSVIYNFLM